MEWLCLPISSLFIPEPARILEYSWIMVLMVASWLTIPPEGSTRKAIYMEKLETPHPGDGGWHGLTVKRNIRWAHQAAIIPIIPININSYQLISIHINSYQFISIPSGHGHHRTSGGGAGIPGPTARAVSPRAAGPWRAEDAWDERYGRDITTRLNFMESKTYSGRKRQRSAIRNVLESPEGTESYGKPNTWTGPNSDSKSKMSCTWSTIVCETKADLQVTPSEWPNTDTQFKQLGGSDRSNDRLYV